MRDLTAADFADFFKAAHDGREPFPWQRRLAELACKGTFPSVIDLPTASGKTTCIDIAVFAMAVQAAHPPDQRTIGRRIFFVVNRRVIVDQAYHAAFDLASKLEKVDSGSILHDVAEALRRISGDNEAPPLDVATMRGGISCDNRWARSITQPTIITSTIDQVGSRLLFRGYGVSHEASPLHAALIANDSLIFLDEAHVSRPFLESLKAIQEYRGDRWAKEPIRTPFQYVAMTATPPENGGDKFELNDDDRRNEVLKQRHDRTKPVALKVASKAKGKKASQELGDELLKEAKSLVSDERHNIAIIVNRVSTARYVYDALQKSFAGKEEFAADAHLVIGRMRPLDRDDLTATIEARLNCRSDSKPMFVIATQCLEVGADYDFDAIVSECASLDALRQRFGRLNRRGRAIDAQGIVVIRAEQLKSADELDHLDSKNEFVDPIYGNALSRTWNWLLDSADPAQSPKESATVDFAVNAIKQRLGDLDLESAGLVAPSVHAPIMFPAYVDFWAQTSPRPVPDPEISLFLHGPERSEPDVNVCWREDLPEQVDENTWRRIVSLCPPTSPECMAVPIGEVRSWFAVGSPDEPDQVNDSDLSEVTSLVKVETAQAPRFKFALAWRGPTDNRSVLISSSSEIRPGDTIVFPAFDDAWLAGRDLGHIPDSSKRDRAEDAVRKSKLQVVFRLTIDRLSKLPETEVTESLRDVIANSEKRIKRKDVRDWLRLVSKNIAASNPVESETLDRLADERIGLEPIERYPESLGIVLRSRERLDPAGTIPAMDDGRDETSRVSRRTPVALAEHLQNVCDEVAKATRLLSVEKWTTELKRAAELHDWGKLDERFQAYLMNGTIEDVGAQPSPWAKHPNAPRSVAQHQRATVSSGRPEGFRHEMLSAQLADFVGSVLPEDLLKRDLILHLITSHHGYGRPFAPIVCDENPPDINLEPLGHVAILSSERRLAHAPERLDSGIGERFWSLTRHFGWWGLAYLEALLRLADQRASQREASQPERPRKSVEELQ